MGISPVQWNGLKVLPGPAPLTPLACVQEVPQNANPSPFQSIAQSKIWTEIFHDIDHPWVRSAQATLALTKELVDLKPAFLQDRSVTVLYPGSGSHVAVLDIAHFLISEKKIDDATFIFTEIVPAAVNDLRKVLQALRDTGFYTTVAEQEKTIAETPPQKEFTFTLTYQGKKITLLFALNRSGEAYYRDEYFARANVFYNHDLSISFNANLAMVLKSLGDTKRTAPLYFMGENPLGPSDLEKSGIYVAFESLALPDPKRRSVFPAPLFFNLLGTVRTVNHGFGHRGQESSTAAAHAEKGPYRYRSAMLLRLDTERLGGFAPKDYERLADFVFLASSALSAEGFANGLTYSQTISQDPSYFTTIPAFIRQPETQKKLAPNDALRALSVYGTMKVENLFWSMARNLIQKKGREVLPFGYYFSQRGPYPMGVGQFFPEPTMTDCREFAAQLPLIAKLVYDDDHIPEFVAEDFQNLVFSVVVLPDPLCESEQDFSKAVASRFRVDASTQQWLQRLLGSLTAEIDRELQGLLAQSTPFSEYDFTGLLSYMRVFGRLGYRANDQALLEQLRQLPGKSIWSADQRVQIEIAVAQVLQAYENSKK